MKVTYTLTARNGYGEVNIKIEAYSISTAELMATEWLKRNFIYHGWLITPTGRRVYVYW